VREGYNLRATCLGCGHVAVIDAEALWKRCRTAKDRLIETIEAKLKCGSCGARKAACQPCDK